MFISWPQFWKKKKKEQERSHLFTRISPLYRFISFDFILFRGGEPPLVKREVFEVRAIWWDVSSSGEKSTSREKWPPSGWIEIWPNKGWRFPVDRRRITRQKHLVPRLNLRSLARIWPIINLYRITSFPPSFDLLERNDRFPYSSYHYQNLKQNWSFRKNVYQYNGCSKYILIKKNLINWIPSKIFFFFKKYLWLFSLWSSINHAPFPRNEIRIEITRFSLSFSRIKEETIETIGTKAWLCIDVGSMTAQVSPGKLIYSRWWISITPLLAWFHARNSICHAVSTHTCLYIYIYIYTCLLYREGNWDFRIALWREGRVDFELHNVAN